MNQRSDNFSRRASPAFTLVEIMVVVVVIGLIISIAVPAYIKIRETAQDKSVLNNARQLAAAFDQYTMETGRTTAAFGVLVGPSAYVKEFATVANETYPAGFTQGQTLTITGVAGQRTITYAP